MKIIKLINNNNLNSNISYTYLNKDNYINYNKI